jgi:hypothetical protein
MRFHLGTVFFIIAVIAASLAAFGPWGLTAAALVLLFWAIAFWRRSGETLLARLSTAALPCIILPCCTCLMWPTVSGVREAARRNQCGNQMRQIALALQLYEQDHGCFPPAILPDENGRPMHSWRVLILPYLDERWLYQAYHFDEPWDGPNNRKLAAKPCAIYRCPSWDGDGASDTTCYVAVVGPDTMWPNGRSRKAEEITDALANTLMVVEAHDTGIRWMEPRDLTVEELLNLAGDQSGGRGNCPHESESHYQYALGWCGAFADGHIQFLNHMVSRDVLVAATTVAGGETTPSLTEARMVRQYIRWQRVVSHILAMLIAVAPIVWLPMHVRRQNDEVS